MDGFMPCPGRRPLASNGRACSEHRPYKFTSSSNRSACCSLSFNAGMYSSFSPPAASNRSRF
jgi:hypothetical protein